MEASQWSLASCVIYLKWINICADLICRKYPNLVRTQVEKICKIIFWNISLKDNFQGT